MKKYNHLSREQRYTIDRLLKQGKSYSFIAETIGVATSTVSREIRRNQIPRGIFVRQAQTYASERKEWCYYPRKFTPKMRYDVEQIIRQQQWSPGRIVGRFRLEGIPIVGKTSLYTFLHNDKKRVEESSLSYETPSKIASQGFSLSRKGGVGATKSLDEQLACIGWKKRLGDSEM